MQVIHYLFAFFAFEKTQIDSLKDLIINKLIKFGNFDSLMIELKRLNNNLLVEVFLSYTFGRLSGDSIE